MTMLNSTNGSAEKLQDQISQLKMSFEGKVTVMALISLNQIENIFALVGNIICVVVIIKFKRLHKAIYYFILNLCAADIVGCFAKLSHLAIYIVSRQVNAFKKLILLCYCYSWLLYVSILTNLTSMLLIGMDRWFSVEYPIKYRVKNKLQDVWILSFLQWTFNIILMSMFLTFEVDAPAKCPEWDFFSETVNSFVRSIFIIASIVLLLCYIRIVLIALDRKKKVNPISNQKLNEWRMKLAKMLGKYLS